MKSKNVKSVSYAKGPKLPLSRNRSIAESTLGWPAASSSSHICGDPFFFFFFGYSLRHAGLREGLLLGLIHAG